MSATPPDTPAPPAHLPEPDIPLPTVVQHMRQAAAALGEAIDEVEGVFAGKRVAIAGADQIYREHDAVRAVDALHSDTHRIGAWNCCRVCIGAIHPCYTLRELNAALGMAYRGTERGSDHWTNFTPHETVLSEGSRRYSGPAWVPGIGREPRTGWFVPAEVFLAEITRLVRPGTLRWEAQRIADKMRWIKAVQGKG